MISSVPSGEKEYKNSPFKKMPSLGNEEPK